MMKVTRWNKNCQIWKLESGLTLDTPIIGVNYEGKYVSLKETGELEIKSGYSWNGCSPKVEIMGMVFGTPEGALPRENEKDVIKKNLGMIGYDQLDWYKPKTYYASLVHDCLYQISDRYATRMDRKIVDNIFLKILRAYGFPSAKLYYLAVRLFGKYCWGM